MRSSGSSWSLILSPVGGQETVKRRKRGIRTWRTNRVCRGNANIRGWVWALATMREVRDVWKKRKWMNVGWIKEVIRAHAHCSEIFNTEGTLDELNYHPELATLTGVFWDVYAEGCCLYIWVCWGDGGVVILSGNLHGRTKGWVCERKE